MVCAPGTPSSGLDTLAKAGVSYQTTQRFPGFVCRIAGKPSNAPCVNTSPASAYWAYWLAAPGGSWCYSTLGAGSRKPAPGTFEGWSFALNRTAGRDPPAAVRASPRAGRIAAGRAQRQRLPVDAHHAACDHGRADDRPADDPTADHRTVPDNGTSADRCGVDGARVHNNRGLDESKLDDGDINHGSVDHRRIGRDRR